MTPLKAIRAKCLDCSCGNPNEVTLCPITECPLYEYRSGKNPKRKGIGGGGNPNFGKEMKEAKARAQVRHNKEDIQ